MQTVPDKIRPVYFLTVFWGPLYRSYFFNYCLPSLLSSRNLGMLSASDGHKYLMCTTMDDWEAIQSLPAMQKLRRHATPVHLQIGLPDDQPDPATAKYRHMARGQQMLVEAAFKDRALGSYVFPDSMFANGSIHAALQYISEGAHAVLTPGLSYATEDIFSQLERHGILQPDHNSYRVPEIDVAPRTLLAAAAPLLCEYLYFMDWNSSKFAYWPSMCLWPVPEGRGMITHRSYFDYTMLDFAAIIQLNNRGFENETIENSWLSDNFPDPDRVRVAQDSDDLTIIYWAPRAMPAPLHDEMRVPLLADLRKGIRLRRVREIHLRDGDIQKAFNFRYLIRLRTGDLDHVWHETEKRVRQVMLLFFGDVFEEFIETRHRPYLPILRLWWLLLRLAMSLIAHIAFIKDNRPRWALIRSYLDMLINDPRLFWHKVWRRVSGQRARGT